MTDNEIIKALECSPLNDIGGCRKIDALDLINRLQAENERLTVNMNAYGLGMKRLSEQIDTAKTEAIKKFAEKLKSQFHISCDYNCIYIRAVINDRVKEMTEGSKC